MANINIKNQDEFNALSWQDKFDYVTKNPNSMITNNEVLRVKQKLETDPTDSAKNYAAGLTAARSGVGIDSILADNFDKNVYGYQGASDNFKRENTMPAASTPHPSPAATPSPQGEGAGNVVAARDYINSVSGNRGVNYNIGFSNGFVTVNGRQLKPEYIENGVAYIKAKDIDSTLSAIDSERGRDTNQGILNENELKWAEDYSRVLDKIRNREEFSYRAKDDPIYREFEDYYLKQAEKDARDIIATASNNTYGITNLGALAMADALKKDRIEALAAYQKQFRDDAYNRYQDELNRQDLELEQIRQLRDEDLTRDWKVHRQNIDDEQTAHDRDWTDRENELALTKTNMELDSAAKQKEYTDAATAVEFQKLTGNSRPWHEDAYGSEILNPYYREDVENERALEQQRAQNELGLEFHNKQADADLARALDKHYATKNYSSVGNFSSGSGLSKNYETKRNKLINSINSWFENESGAKPIVQTANGRWQLADGVTEERIEAIENAIETNDFGLTEDEQYYLYESLGIGDWYEKKATAIKTLEQGNPFKDEMKKRWDWQNALSLVENIKNKQTEKDNASLIVLPMPENVPEDWR